MDKETFINNFIVTAMSSYAAVQYDHNCSVGWRNKEQFMHACDAKLLANQAWERLNDDQYDEKRFNKIKSNG